MPATITHGIGIAWLLLTGVLAVGDSYSFQKLTNLMNNNNSSIRQIKKLNKIIPV